MRIMHIGWGYRPWRIGGLIAYAEDVMEAQVRRGHEVTYLFAGRQFPLLRRPRLHLWARNGVRMAEVLNVPVPVGGDRGTHVPELELDEPRTERIARRVVNAFPADLIHVQELVGLPSSLLGLGAERGVPVVMTLQDYFPLCPTLKLYDSDGRVCLRRYPAEHCRRCSASAPLGTAELRRHTVGAEGVRLARRLPRWGEPLRRAYRSISAVGVRSAEMPAPGARAPTPGPSPTPAYAFQRRRDVNLERLGRVDRLLAMSTRVEEIYAQLGVAADRLQTMPDARPSRWPAASPDRSYRAAGAVRHPQRGGVLAEGRRPAARRR